jgi:glycyl-tRNA synthetase
VCDALEALDEACALRLKSELESEAKKGTIDVPGLGPVELTGAMASVARETKKVSGRRFVPSVIEPSFGIGRILYCIFEHAFYERPPEAPAADGPAAAKDDGAAVRSVFRFTPLVAPIKATVFPLLQREALNAKAQAISAALTREGLSSLVDTTGVSIGRRYARTDELGVPFAVTVDHQTVGGAAAGAGGGEGEGDGSVTVRERDSMAQVRVPGDEVARLLRRLVDGEVTWAEVAAKYPAQAVAADK